MRTAVRLLSAALLLALLLALGGPGALAASALPDGGSEITGLCRVTCSDGESVARLLDGDYATLYRYSSGVTVTVESPEPIQGRYLIWNRPPGTWTLCAGEDTRTLGQEGYLHEYVPLDGERAVSVTLPKEGAQFCDLYVFGPGTLPDWVQLWTPPCEQAELLVFSTHSDDELIFYGGLLPTYAGEYGYEVQLVYLTSHWKEAVRPHELLCGLWTVGVTHYPVFSPIDDWSAYQGNYGSKRFEEFEVEQLRRFRPQVAVVQDLGGEYGHPTHIAGSNAMLSAVESAADPEQYPESAEKYGVWDLPKLYIHMYPERQLVMDWHVPLRAFDGRTSLEMDVLGYACHYSQHHLVFNIHEEGSGDCRRFGLYRSLVGDDDRPDLFCNTGLSPRRGLLADMAAINGEEGT